MFKRRQAIQSNAKSMVKSIIKHKNYPRQNNTVYPTEVPKDTVNAAEVMLI